MADIEARLTYLQWQPSYAYTRPYKIGQFARRRMPGKQREKTTNLVFCAAEQTETIRDIRALEPLFNLDTNGFAYKRCHGPALTKPYDYSDEEKIKSIFLPECEAILKNEIEAADDILIFDWKVGNTNLLLPTATDLGFDVDRLGSEKAQRSEDGEIQICRVLPGRFILVGYRFVSSR
jgi:hypothetical protein